MLAIAAASSKDLLASSEPIALFAFEDAAVAGAAALPPKLRKAVQAAAADEAFKGKSGQVASFKVTDPSLGLTERRFLVAGLGKKKDCDGEAVRKAAGSVYRAAKARFKAIWVLPPGEPGPAAEGLLLASHQFDKYKKPEGETVLAEARMPAQGAGERARLEKALAKAGVYCEAVCWVRDRVNEGPSDKSPEALAEHAKALGKLDGITVKIIDKAQAEKLGMGSYLGVARGSAKPPCFVHLVYKPKGRVRKRIGLVGKGVTFDSGGLSLKPPQHMETMKMDMAGAATVLGVLSALPRLKVEAEVHGIAPLTYNMPGPDAIKPGDVLKAMNGKTIEVLNTDAEGRLILADALVYATQQKLDAIIDLATLTGAAVIALGSQVSAAMTNNPALLRAVAAASRTAGEPIWELPLHKGYQANIKSKIADIQNIGKARGEAGTIIGGLFLQEFVDGKPWVHLDIAGSAWSDNGDGICASGGTGVMVRTLLEYLQAL